MACLTLKTTLPPQATLSTAATPGASLGVTVGGRAAVGTEMQTPLSLGMEQAPQAALEVNPAAGAAQLTLGEVCTVNSGTIVALAASDGPLRTRNGGYFLLNPATNPPQG